MSHTWTPTEVPVPTGGVTPGDLSAVSCVTGWGCVAIGIYTPDGAGATVTGEIVAAPL